MVFLDFINVNYTYCLIAVLSILFLIKRSRQRKSGNYPPGPKGYPLVGHLRWITGQQDVVMRQLEKEYGDVVMFPVGYENVVIFNTLEGVRESFIKHGDNFAGQRNNFKMMDHFMDVKGIFVEEGNIYKEQRKFILNSLKEFGVGKTSLEDTIINECVALVSEIKSIGEKPFYAGALLTKTTVNILCKFINGVCYEYNDPKLDFISDLFERVDINFSMTYAADYFPFLRYLPKCLQGTSAAERIKEEVNTYLNEVIDDHNRSFDEHNIKDFTDLFIQQIKRSVSSGTVQHKVYDYEHLRANQVAMFVAGSITTAMTLLWTIKLLITHPHVQEKLVHEIDRVVGRERHPSWQDRSSMLFTEATLHEVQRYADVVPIGVPHTTMEDTKVLGFDIPKRSFVFGNFKKLHNDPKIWDDPQNFRPERFLDASEGGEKIINTEKLFVFGVGRRRCVGEALSRMNLFQILVSLMQNFTFHPLEGAKDPGVTSGLVRYLLPFDVIAKPRQVQ